jgi:uncharacterized protein YgfB (UPF0149 family)
MGNSSEQVWTRVEAALQSAGALGDPAEIHGEFCGLACVMGRDAVSPWAAAALSEADARSAAAIATLEELGEKAWSELDAGDMSFDLLLPADDESLERRAELLGIWCQGFMHGLGAAGAAGEESPVVRNETIEGIVGDFSEITRAGFTADETEEEGEAALAELVEYVRVAVQLVFEELHAIRSDPPASETH